MIFTPGVEYHDTYNEDGMYKVKSFDDVMIDHDEWRRAKDLKVGDKILTSDNTYDTISYIELMGDTYYICV